MVFYWSLAEKIFDLIICDPLGALASNVLILGLNVVLVSLFY
jgi:hypothetical protein